MKRYKGNRKIEDIFIDMVKTGIDVDREDFDNGGDYCTFKGFWYGLPLTIFFNTFNGQFAVYNGFTGLELATHTSDNLDSEEWYSNLLDTLYEPLI